MALEPLIAVMLWVTSFHLLKASYLVWTGRWESPDKEDLAYNKILLIIQAINLLTGKPRQKEIRWRQWQVVAAIWSISGILGIIGGIWCLIDFIRIFSA
jgi:UDP-N-acetylmuramyl pentapeptide phosphotransferase/UDP-N-acetylglucosamine-1-phosphate transferase